MTSAEPKTKYDELIDRLNSLPREKAATVFEVREVMQEAEKLKSVDPGKAFSLMGMAACVQHNLDEMRKLHLRAIDLDRLPSLEPYAISLRRLGFNDEALAEMRKAQEISPNDYETLEMLAYLALDCGRFQEAERWFAQLEKNYPEQIPYNIGPWLRDTLLPCAKNAQLADQDIADVISLACEVAHEKDVIPLSIDYLTGRSTDDPDYVIDVVVGVRGIDAEEIAEMNLDLAIKRSEAELPPSVDNAIVVRFSKEPPDARNAA